MVKIFYHDNKYKTLLIILLFLFFLAVAMWIIFSNINIEKVDLEHMATVLNEGDLIVSYNDGMLIDFRDDEVHKYSISITNNSYDKLYYSILLEDCNVSELEIVVKDKEGNIVNKVTNPATKILKLYSIPKQETVRYLIELKSIKNYRVTAKFKVLNESLSSEMFSDLILLNNKVGIPKSRLGVDVATENEGLIESFDNDGRTYFFRGNVVNNYFKINDLMFRIVRINGDNSVRVVYNDVLNLKYAYNTGTLKKDEEVSSLVLFSNSTIRQELSDWFNDNFKQYKKYLAKTSYCSDTEFNLVNNNVTYSSAYERIFNDKAPDLYCYGEINKSYVGLLSVDEVVLAGAASNKPNTSYYLYNKSIQGNYLTGSSYSINSQNGVAMINVMSNGALGDGLLITNLSNIRPVINIAVNAKIKGNGTFDNPYIMVS